MALYKLIYRSQEAFPFNDEALARLLMECRLKNSHKNISGILLYGYGYFIQMLEGEEHEVRSLFHEKILHDPRHTSVKILNEGLSYKRLYPTWAMAYRPYDPESVLDVQGYVNPDKQSIYGRNLLSPLKTLEAMELLSMEVNNRIN
ncbi:MAG: BLUF domain-containing protein [Saprospiraceae bacterium]|nr:BLUF domain-containing protein [Saprospiraceae bacterium]